MGYATKNRPRDGISTTKGSEGEWRNESQKFSEWMPERKCKECYEKILPY